MHVWRLCRRPYAELSGEGGRLAPGRWHSAGKPVIYTAYEPALAILEVRVHLDIPYEDLPDDYVMMGIDLGSLSAPPPPDPLPADTQQFGDAWLASKSSALLVVPSVLAPRGLNYLINPVHPDAKEITIAMIESYDFDGRLWNKN